MSVLLFVSLLGQFFLFPVQGAPSEPLSTDQEIIQLSSWETSEPMMKSLSVKPIPSPHLENSAVQKPELLKSPPLSTYDVHKRKIKGKKSFMQYLLEKSAIYQATSTTAQPVIYNTETNTTYSVEGIAQMCKEADEVGNNFGISDVSSFAVSNCRLIRIYYPSYTCQQITDFLEYCKNIKSTL